MGIYPDELDCWIKYMIELVQKVNNYFYKVILGKVVRLTSNKAHTYYVGNVCIWPCYLAKIYFNKSSKNLPFSSKRKSNFDTLPTKFSLNPKGKISISYNTKAVHIFTLSKSNLLSISLREIQSTKIVTNSLSDITHLLPTLKIIFDIGSGIRCVLKRHRGR